MSTTFNGLVLDELGTIGNPQIEYANFIATTASPAGYDGAVLKNFKRDYTTIKFDLTLGGTESECLNKLNTVVGALNAGQGELVMPGQAERGTHFNAVPNMKIAHSLRGFDGMTIPCTFIVPEGCAIKSSIVTLTPLEYKRITNDSPLDMHLTFSGIVTEEWTANVPIVAYLSASDTGPSRNYETYVAIPKPNPRPQTYTIPEGLEFEYSTETLAATGNYGVYAQSASFDLYPMITSIPPGGSVRLSYSIPRSATAQGLPEVTVTTRGMYVW